MRGVTKTQKPPLGKLRAVPAKERKTMFFASPIDLDKWNRAGWKGMLYLFQPGYCPVLGLVFDNYEVAKSIFSTWKNMCNGDSADAFLKMDYIIPPFPKGCWVYSEADRSFGKGYFVHLGPNVDKAISRAEKSGLKKEEMILASITRYQWMDEVRGTTNRDMFKKLTDQGAPYLLIPIGIRNPKKPVVEENLIIGDQYAIKMNEVSFTAGTDVKEDNMYSAVLKKPEVI